MNKWLLLALMAAFLTIAFIVGCHYGEMRSEAQETSDTMIVSDTVWKIVMKDTTIIKKVPKKIEIIKRDTITKDTVLETQHKTYEDTICKDKDSVIVKSCISGINAQLDSMQVSWKKREKIITNTITIEKQVKQRITYGLQGGYGITPKGFQPYIGVGVQINL